MDRLQPKTSRTVAVAVAEKDGGGAGGAVAVPKPQQVGLGARWWLGREYERWSARMEPLQESSRLAEAIR